MEKRMESETSLELPQELIEEILYYLPAKNLLKLKCVSKSWNSLISSKSFIKEHAKKSNTDGNLNHNRSKVMLNYDDSRKRVEFMRALCQPGILVLCPIQNFLHNDDPVATALDSHRMKKSGYDIQIKDVRILGSCNGLILISVNDWRYLFLWNPFTRKMRNIPHVTCFSESEFSAWNAQPFTYSLGYDEYADDYKVVCISKYKKLHHTHIYSSKTNTWKKIESFDKGNLLHKNSGKFVNGKLHWLATLDDGVYEIISLDLRKEKYEIVARPENFSKYVRPFFRNMGGYLGLITLNSSIDDINVWVMMKYGVRESWTKIWTLSYLEYSKTEICCGASPLCMKKNGDIIIAFENNVVVYNGRNGLRKFRFDMLDGVIDSVVYVETLVSPFGDEELGQ